MEMRELLFRVAPEVRTRRGRQLPISDTANVLRGQAGWAALGHGVTPITLSVQFPKRQAKDTVEI